MLLKHKGYRNKFQYIQLYELSGVTSFDICLNVMVLLMFVLHTPQKFRLITRGRGLLFNIS